MMHYVIVFENLRFRPSTRKRVASVFKNLHSGERFWKDAWFGDRFHRIQVNGRRNRREKKFVFKQKRKVVWTVLFWRSPGLPYRTLRVPALEWLTKLHPLLLKKKVVLQGFRQVFKVADIILKAPDAIFFSGARRLASAEGSSYPRGSGGMLPHTDF